MTDKFEQIQVLFQVRNARKRGPTSSDEFNDMLEEIAHDFSTLNDQWNNRLVPLGNAIPDGTDDSSVDAYANGLDGANLYVDHDSTISSNALYFNTSLSRPNTVFEQFDLFYTTMNEIRDDLENQINNTVLTASEISIADTGALYNATNVEDALAEVKTQADYLQALDFGNVSQDILPSIDNYYSIGSPTLRFKNIYVTGSSLHIVAFASEAGGTARDYSFEVDSTDGALLLKQGINTIRRTLYTGAIQIPELASDPTQETGYGTLYVKSSDSKLYYRDSGGDITELGGGATQVNVLELAADSDNDEASSYISMSVDGTEALRIDENQRIGIGTASPGEDLDIKGASGATATLRVMGNGASDDAEILLTDSNTPTAEGLRLWYDSSAGSCYIDSIFDNAAGDIHFRTKTAGTPVSAMTIESAGNVGIGTTSPGEKLHVAGNISTVGAANRYIKASGFISNAVGQNADFGASDVGFYVVTGGHLQLVSGGNTDAVRIASGGNVGIGTASPSTNLHIKSTTDAAIWLEADSDNVTETDNPYIKMTQDGGTTWNNIGITGANDVDAAGNAFTGAIQNYSVIHSGYTGTGVHIGAVGQCVMTIHPNAKVGIGTASPSELLTVGDGTGAGSNIALDGAAGQSKNIIYESGGSARWNIFSTDEAEGGSEAGSNLVIGRYTDAGGWNGRVVTFRRDTGRVGIGTDSPDTKLHVYGGSAGSVSALADSIVTIENDGNAFLSFLTPSTSDSAGIYWGDNYDNDRAWILYGHDADDLKIGVNTATRMAIDSSGNVGIGTASPGAKLDIVTGATTSSEFHLGEVADEGIWMKTESAFDGSFSVGCEYISGSWTARSTQAGRMEIGNGHIKFYTDEGLTDGNTFTPSMRMIIRRESGNVGIGTDNPGFPLEINASGSAGINVHSTTSGQTTYIELGNGGTGDRHSWIDLVGDDTYTDYGLRLWRKNGGANTSSTIAHRGTSGLYLTAVDAGFLSFRTADTDRVRINSSGQVGIGTASPDKKLDVNGSIKLATDIFWRNNTSEINSAPTYGIGVSDIDLGGGASKATQISDYYGLSFCTEDVTRMVVNKAGNVGIGTTTPTSFRLSVETNTSGTGYVARFFNDGNNSNRRGIEIQAGEDSPSGTNRFIDFLDGDGGDAGGIQRVTVGTPSFRTPSDARIKKDIAPTKVNAIEILNKLPLKEYKKFKASIGAEKEYENPELTSIGWVAQDVENILPFMVSTDKKDGTKSVSDTNLVPYLVKAVQELAQKLEEANARIVALESKEQSRR